MSMIYDNSDARRFRPRYDFEDTAHLLPQDTPIPLYIRCYRCLACCCSSRRRLAVVILLIAGISLTVLNIDSIQQQSPHTARIQSYGYVHEPKHAWVDRAIHNRQVPHEYLPLPTDSESIPLWYATHVLVDFECPSLKRVVGSASDPSKWWVCNIGHLASIQDCVIYTTGPPNGLLVETKLQLLLPECSIHVLDPTRLSTSPPNSTIHVHTLGLSASTKLVSQNDDQNHVLEVKTLPDVMKTLGHDHIDVLILSCPKGCEWSIYEQLVQVNIHQLIVQVHGMQHISFFTKLREAGFVLFHKAPTDWKGLMGQAHVLSFLKLKPQFFKLEKR